MYCSQINLSELQCQLYLPFPNPFIVLLPNPPSFFVVVEYLHWLKTFETFTPIYAYFKITNIVLCYCLLQDCPQASRIVFSLFISFTDSAALDFQPLCLKLKPSPGSKCADFSQLSHCGQTVPANLVAFPPLWKWNQTQVKKRPQISIVHTQSSSRFLLLLF